MELLKEISGLFAPALLFVLFVSLAALRMQIDKTRRLEEEIKKINLYSIKQTAIMVKYCNVPIEVLLDDLKTVGPYLSSVPQDDILGQVLDKYVRS